MLSIEINVNVNASVSYDRAETQLYIALLKNLFFHDLYMSVPQQSDCNHVLLKSMPPIVTERPLCKTTDLVRHLSAPPTTPPNHTDVLPHTQLGIKTT